MSLTMDMTIPGRFPRCAVNIQRSVRISILSRRPRVVAAWFVGTICRSHGGTVRRSDRLARCDADYSKPEETDESHRDKVHSTPDHAGGTSRAKRWIRLPGMRPQIQPGFRLLRRLRPPHHCININININIKMKKRVYVIVPNKSRTLLARVEGQSVAIPGWPEVPAVLHRPVTFGDGQSRNEPTIARRGWKVSCAECGGSLMNGRQGSTKAAALQIVVDNFAIFLETANRDRILKVYEQQRALCVAECRDLAVHIP